MGDKKQKLIDLLFHEIFDKGNIGIIDSVIHDNYDRDTENLVQGTAQYIVKPELRKEGKEGFKEFVRSAIQKSLQAGIFEIKHNIQSIVVEGKKQQFSIKFIGNKTKLIEI